MSELRVGDPATVPRYGWVLGALLAAPAAWLAVAVAPQAFLLARVDGSSLSGLPSFVTGMIAGGAAAGYLVVLVRRFSGGGGVEADRGVVGVVGGRWSTVRWAAVAAVVGTLGTAVGTFLLAGGSMAGWWPSGASAGSEIVAGLTVVALAATAGGLALGLLAALGPVWLRACAVAVPIAFAHDALLIVASAFAGPASPVAPLVTSWFLAVLVGVALGTSVAAGRPWTWVLWAPALTLVWVAQSLRPAISAALQQVHMGAEVLRAYPFEPLRVLGEHLWLTLIDPGSHGPVSLWVIAPVVGVAVAGWRLRGPR
ncbi:hypothetical protein [Myceligenerans pegani]|uniref:ABC transporter permease n=1 Tax=Myceligenerans pegani TaxID=2776917 RepID=A0ABR9MXY9_9MICO|nr:hypothetical protein [Myceligenerans sp. TRM 65318]MBE1876253.1 hypothetical protein [Myceligenerans sp. TRM 65318]MBE3018524.1 hypothetical protein [Myceligenerans sp. TRM 65318]